MITGAWPAAVTDPHHPSKLHSFFLTAAPSFGSGKVCMFTHKHMSNLAHGMTMTMIVTKIGPCNSCCHADYIINTHESHQAK